MCSSAPSAKELVEATGRFLSRFYRSKEALQRRRFPSAEGIGPIRDPDDSAALLCSRFYPGLEGESPLPSKVIDPCGEKSYPAANRSTVNSEMGSGRGGSYSCRPRVDIVKEEDEIAGSKHSEEHRPLADDSPASRPKRKGHRKKGGKGKGNGKGQREGKGASNSRKRGQPPHVLESPAMDGESWLTELPIVKCRIGDSPGLKLLLFHVVYAFYCL